MTADAGRDNAGHDSGERDAAGQEKAGFRGAESRAGAASDLPDPRKLAQDWITLWQSELSAMAADSEMRESWQTVMALWAGAMSTLLRGLPRAPTDPSGAARHAGAERHDRTDGLARTADAPRATSAAAASDARDAEIERLARHVAILERRLADLERGPDPPVHPKRSAGRKARK